MTKHPAKFTPRILEVLGDVMDAHGIEGRILDPFAGTGRVHTFHDPPRRVTYGVELEPEWAAMHERTQVGSALALPWPAGTFSAIVTSPTYGNRMADTYRGDGTRRHTYTIALGRQLTGGNSGALQWGGSYKDFHARAWTEALRVLRPGGAFILNISDHVRAGARQHVAGWHALHLQAFCGPLVDVVPVATPRQRHGANGAARVDAELVLVFLDRRTP